jgi:uncharacterized membrane protein
MSESDRSIAELMQELSERSTTLIRRELELARLEMTEKGKRAGVGAGMFGAAGVFGLYAVGALTACLVLALATAMTAWVAALIVAGVYGAVAGVLALNGRAKVKQAVPPVPEQASESVKEDVQWAKSRATEARS